MDPHGGHHQSNYRILTAYSTVHNILPLISDNGDQGHSDARFGILAKIVSSNHPQTILHNILPLVSDNGDQGHLRRVRFSRLSLPAAVPFDPFKKCM